ncbi:ankyrin repeat-containing domain protein [Tricladium varicosporioides]|nr:ankyrin repeat-containing domain protein [Hymenoscyphus varicosporioides]
MDPLSITASVIAVATLAAKVTVTISKMRAIYELPGRLHAINNEVADLEVVLRQISTITTERKALQQLPAPTCSDDALPNLLSRADDKLRKLKQILERLLKSCVGGGKFVARAKVWCIEKSKLHDLQDELHVIKASLNVMLGASHSQDMMRVQLDLQSISLVASQAAEKHTIFRDDINQFLKQNSQFFDERIAALEQVLVEQFSQLQNNIKSEMGTRLLQNPARALKSSMNAGVSRELARRNSKSSASINGLRIRTAYYTGRTCQVECRCNCHSSFGLRTPNVVEPMIGRLFVGYAGIPLFRPKCNDTHCRKSQAPSISIEYWFPLWFLAQVIKIILAYQPGAGPHLQIRAIRRIPDSAKAIAFALDGNIAGMRALFVQGLASPYDVSETRNFSLLRWAVYANQLETCKFLIEAGADPQEEDPNERSSDRMWDLVLTRGLTDSQRDTIQCLLDQSDYIEEHNFPLVHKIVLKLSLRGLEEELMANPLAVFETDSEGRSALCWAAGRGDERSTLILLSHGADPNVLDKNGRSPLYLAADEARAGCVRLLLEAGASPDPQSPKGVPSRSSPLLCAAMTPHDKMALKTLLDFGANPNSKSPTGETPLMAVARCRAAADALLLIQHGAEVNARAKNGRTSLTTAIAYNNHGVLQILLDKWKQYDKCPRLAGPDLLHITADFADVETIKILSTAEHLRLRGDKAYVLAAKPSERMANRPDMSEDLIAAFEEMLCLISDKREEEDMEALIESGLLTHSTSSLSDTEGNIYIFEDAHETIDMEV